MRRSAADVVGSCVVFFERKAKRWWQNCCLKAPWLMALLQLVVVVVQEGIFCFEVCSFKQGASTGAKAVAVAVAVVFVMVVVLVS